MNFFNSTVGSVDESQAGQTFAASNFYRIFDFVTVPSRFRGTQTWFNQQTVNRVPGMPAKISKFREPGRINLNTAYEAAIWRAALGYDSQGAYDFELALTGRRMLRPSTETPDEEPEHLKSRAPSGRFPAEYPFPNRSAVSADLVPPLLDGGSLQAPRWGVDATLFRTSAFEGNPARTRSGARMLFASRGEPALSKFFAHHEIGYGPAERNRRSNAYFRYRDIIKLGASATPQSNVYAIWLTVGFFEIEPNYPATKQNEDGSFVYDMSRPYHVDEAHPDGYRFGPEMGSELGNVERHRSFYIIDRSIPVAFEPGVNHNTDDAILLRRHLE